MPALRQRPDPPPNPALERIRAEIAGDFPRACQTLYKIRPKAGGALAPLALWPDQRREQALIEAQERAEQPVRLVKLKCRQGGSSTYAVARLLHHLHWTPLTSGLLIAHDDETTAALYDIARTIYDALPPELQHPLKRLNKRALVFEKPHASFMATATAGWAGAGRGRTMQHGVFSEIEYWNDPPTSLAAIEETIPMEAGTSIIIETTARAADGWLAGFWPQVKAGKTDYVGQFTPWFVVPGYRRPIAAPLELTPEEQERVQKHRVTHEQIAWYRAKAAAMIARDPWGGVRKMRAEYPYDDQECFQSVGLCIFPDPVLSRLREGVIPPARAYQLVPTGDHDFKAVPCPPEAAHLWVWKKREDARLYSFGIDVADGVQQTESVIEGCAYPGYEQVFEFADNGISPDRLAVVAGWLARKYGGTESVLVTPEVNKSGILLMYVLQQIALEADIFRWRYFDRPGLQESDKPRLGWTTNEQTKGILAQVANLLYLRGDGHVRSQVLHEQMTRCIDIVPGSRWTTKGRSDRVLAWLIAQVGAYFDFEGGVAGGMGSARGAGGQDAGKDDERPKFRERGSFDDEDDDTLAAVGLGPTAYMNAEDCRE